MVAVEEGKFEPVRVTVPFLIWPSVKTLFVSGLLAVGLSSVLPTVLGQVGSSADPAAECRDLRTEIGFLTRTFGINTATTVGVDLLGSLLIDTGLVDEGE